MLRLSWSCKASRSCDFPFQVIVSRGGRFLEAPVSGNQQLSNDGMLVILAAGDRGLYEDCSSCFQAMGKTSFFLGNVPAHPLGHVRPGGWGATSPHTADSVHLARPLCRAPPGKVSFGLHSQCLEGGRASSVGGR